MSHVPRQFSIAALGGVLTFLAVRGCSSAPPALRREPIHAPALVARDVAFVLHAGTEPRIVVTTVEGPLETDLPLSLVVDGTPRALTIDKSKARSEGSTVTAPVRFELDGSEVVGSITLHTEAETDALVVSVLCPVVSGSNHTLALEVDVPTQGGTAFVSGVGPIADLGMVSGRNVIVEEGAYVL